MNTFGRIQLAAAIVALACRGSAAAIRRRRPTQKSRLQAALRKALRGPTAIKLPHTTTQRGGATSTASLKKSAVSATRNSPPPFKRKGTGAKSMTVQIPSASSAIPKRKPRSPRDTRLNMERSPPNAACSSGILPLRNLPACVTRRLPDAAKEIVPPSLEIARIFQKSCDGTHQMRRSLCPWSRSDS